MLEVGPKYGIHTRWIDEQLRPAFLAFSDFEEDRDLHEEWERDLSAPHAWVYGDLRHAEELRRHGPFDLVFFLGVLYHSAFHLELLGMLNRVTRLGGEMLLETTIDPRPDSAVRVRWQPRHGQGEDGADLRRAPDRARVDRLARRDRLHRLPARVERGAAPLPQDGRARPTGSMSPSVVRPQRGTTSPA